MVNRPKCWNQILNFRQAGLRDLQAIEWMFILKNKFLLNKQTEITQTENFITMLREQKYTSPNECSRILESYKMVLGVRNLLHIFNQEKSDRFEFSMQEKISDYFLHEKNSLQPFMKKYFEASNVIFRFTKSMLKRFAIRIYRTSAGLAGN